jgi:hypothetical protein
MVMAFGYSRVLDGLMLPSRQCPDLLAGHWELLVRTGAVPHAPCPSLGQRVGGRLMARRPVEADC